MALAELGARRVFANLAYIRATPWKTNEDGKLTLTGASTYDLTEVVADTTSVEQAENDTNVLEHEFSSNPLFENITLGDKTFACESIDLQNPVLGALFGWTVGSSSEGKAGDVYAPSTYKHLYALVEMAFVNSEDVIILPKVLLNSRAVIASMKTDASRANITGTCYNAFVDGVETDMAILSKAKDVEGTNVETLLARVTDEKPSV